jgi:molybdopterin converting factor subunit 1
MIQVKVKCFSQVKYALDTHELALELEIGTTTTGLEKIIREKADGKLDGVSLRVAVNQKYVPEETVLNDGDEVAFIPPVQGG